MDYTWYYDSPLGEIMLTSDGDALVGLWFEGQKHFDDRLKSEGIEKRLPIFKEAERWLDIYFSGKAPDFTPALSIRTTLFRKMVWEILLSIPYGKIMTYGKIARLIAEKLNRHGFSARAVGGAVGHNPISLIIPCHRVVGAGGSLTGYAGGLDRKMALLELEKVNMENFFVPKKATAPCNPA